MNTLWQDLRYALRILGKSPGFTAVAVSVLAIGLVANAVIFSFADSILLRPLPIHDPSGLVRIFTTQKTSAGEYLYGDSSYPDFLDVRGQAKSFSDIAAYGRRGAVLTAGEERVQLLVNWVSGNYFSFLGVRPLLGRFFTEEEVSRPDAPLAIVLSYAAWQKRFGGDPSIVGKEVQLNLRLCPVIGIAPKEFHGLDPGFSPELWIPQELWAREETKDRNSRPMEMIARLAPGTSLSQARAEADTIARRLAAAYPATNADRRLTVELDTQHQRRRALPIVLSLMVLAGLVVVIACANLAGLLLARATHRRREIAVRMALGAGRGRLVRQLLIEGLMLALLGAGCSLLLSDWSIPLLSTLLPRTIPIVLDSRFDIRVVLFTLGTSLLAVFLFALMPALRASKIDLLAGLNDRPAKSDPQSRGISLMSSFVVGQLAVSVMVLIGAGLLLRTLWKAQSIDLGFDKGQKLLLLDIAPGFWGYDDQQTRILYRQIVERVGALPGVQQASLVQRFPLSPSGGGAAKNVYLRGMELTSDKEGVPIHYTVADSGYFQIARIHILRGRTFGVQDSLSGPSVVVINEAMSRYFWTGQDAVSQHLRIGGPKGRDCEVIGIVQDGKNEDVTEVPAPYLYLPLSQQMTHEITLLVKTAGDPLPMAGVIRRELRALDSKIYTLDVTTLEELIGFALFVQRMTSQIVIALGLMGMALAAVGLYGVVSYSVSRRASEIGTRMALGAQRSDILRLVLGKGLRLTLLGTGLGLIGALGLTHYLATLLYGVSPSDPPTFFAVAALLAGVMLLASYLPAHRATRLDPMTSLREQ